MLKNFNLEYEGTEIELRNDQRLVTKKGEITPIVRSNFNLKCYYEIPHTEEGIRVPRAVGAGLRWYFYVGLLKEKMTRKKAEELTKRYFENKSLEGYLHGEIEVIRPFIYKKHQRSQDWRFWNAFETKGILYRLKE